MVKKGGYTGGRFRSYDLWGVIHNHPQVVPSGAPGGGGRYKGRGRCFNSALPLRHTGEVAMFNVACIANDGLVLITPARSWGIVR